MTFDYIVFSIKISNNFGNILRISKENLGYLCNLSALEFHVAIFLFLRLKNVTFDLSDLIFLLS